MGVSVTLVVGVGGKKVGVGEKMIAGFVGEAMGDPVGAMVAISIGALAEFAGMVYSICNSGAPAWSTS